MDQVSNASNHTSESEMSDSDSESENSQLEFNWLPHWGSSGVGHTTGSGNLQVIWQHKVVHEIKVRYHGGEHTMPGGDDESDIDLGESLTLYFDGLQGRKMGTTATIEPMQYCMIDIPLD